MSFGAIPVRSNGQKILYSWFNALRSAGVLIEAFLGGGFVGKTEFAIPNNTGPSNITGLVFAGATYRKVTVEWWCYRVSTGGGAENKAGGGTLEMFYNPSTAAWDYAELPGAGDAGLTLSCTSAGQVQYTSDNMGGTYTTGSSKMFYTARSLDV